MTNSVGWLRNAAYDSSWRELSVCVAGVGVSGVACARALAELGARVTIVDARSGSSETQAADELAGLGVEVRLGDGETLPTVLTQAQANLPTGRIKTLAFDKAADSDDVHRLLSRERIKPWVETLLNTLGFLLFVAVLVLAATRDVRQLWEEAPEPPAESGRQ